MQGDAGHSRLFCCEHAAAAEWSVAHTLLSRAGCLAGSAECCALRPAPIRIGGSAELQGEGPAAGQQLRVWPGPSGLELFRLQLQMLDGSRLADDDVEFEIRWQAPCPGTTPASQIVVLPGLASYGVASYCAAIGQFLQECATNARANRTSRCSPWGEQPTGQQQHEPRQPTTPAGSTQAAPRDGGGSARMAGRAGGAQGGCSSSKVPPPAADMTRAAALGIATAGGTGSSVQEADAVDAPETGTESCANTGTAAAAESRACCRDSEWLDILLGVADLLEGGGEGGAPHPPPVSTLSHAPRAPGGGGVGGPGDAPQAAEAVGSGQPSPPVSTALPTAAQPAAALPSLPLQAPVVVTVRIRPKPARTGAGASISNDGRRGATNAYAYAGCPVRALSAPSGTDGFLDLGPAPDSPAYSAPVPVGDLLPPPLLAPPCGLLRDGVWEAAPQGAPHPGQAAAAAAPHIMGATVTRGAPRYASGAWAGQLLAGSALGWVEQEERHEPAGPGGAAAGHAERPAGWPAFDSLDTLDRVEEDDGWGSLEVVDPTGGRGEGWWAARLGGQAERREAGGAPGEELLRSVESGAGESWWLQRPT